MECIYCKMEIPDHARRCPECGGVLYEGGWIVPLAAGLEAIVGKIFLFLVIYLAYWFGSGGPESGPLPGWVLPVVVIILFFSAVREGKKAYYRPRQEIREPWEDQAFMTREEKSYLLELISALILMFSFFLLGAVFLGYMTYRLGTALDFPTAVNLLLGIGLGIGIAILMGSSAMDKLMKFYEMTPGQEILRALGIALAMYMLDIIVYVAIRGVESGKVPWDLLLLGLSSPAGFFGHLIG